MTVGRTRPHNAHHGGDRFLHQGHRTDACHLSCLKGGVLLHLIECRRNRDDRALDLRAHLFWQVSEQGLEDFGRAPLWRQWRSEEHTSELQSLMRISYAVFCLKNKKDCTRLQTITNTTN